LLIIGGVTRSGTSRTRAVCATYCRELEHRRAQHDRAGRDRQVLPTANAERVDHLRHARRARHVAHERLRPAEEVLPAVSMIALTTSGFVSGKFDGARARRGRCRRRARAPLGLPVSPASPMPRSTVSCVTR
jgi:hypothetical protein